MVRKGVQEVETENRSEPGERMRRKGSGRKQIPQG
jgi:hypothetical protein